MVPAVYLNTCKCNIRCVCLLNVCSGKALSPRERLKDTSFGYALSALKRRETYETNLSAKNTPKECIHDICVVSKLFMFYR